MYQSIGRIQEKDGCYTSGQRLITHNSQAEVAKKTIQKYLIDYMDKSTLDWELYIAPSMFAYNTSFHQSVTNTPHFLTFGVHAGQPVMDLEEINQQFCGNQEPEKLLRRV